MLQCAFSLILQRNQPGQHLDHEFLPFRSEGKKCCKLHLLFVCVCARAHVRACTERSENISWELAQELNSGDQTWLQAPLATGPRCWSRFWFFFFCNYLFYVCESFACLHICVPCACLVPQEVRRGLTSPGTGITDSELSCGFQELNPDPL